MAMVNVDLSEYDMLRECKNKAEQRVKELEDEIKEYQKKARVIVTTKKCFRTLDINAVATDFTRAYLQQKIYSTGLRSYSILDSDPMARARYEQEREESIIKNAISEAIRRHDNADAYHSLESSSRVKYDSSTEIKGFEDVRLKVEETLKEEYKAELESKLAEAKKAKEEYQEKYAKVEKKVKEDIASRFEATIEAKGTTILTLEGKVQELKDIITKKDSVLKANRDVIERLETELELAKSTNTRVENYKATAHSLELEKIKLTTELDDIKRQLKVANANLNKDKKPWWKF